MPARLNAIRPLQAARPRPSSVPGANELWMTDLMFGPTLKLAGGKVLQTRLFGFLDDCSRLVPHAQYYESEKLCWFLDCFRQALARRGFPDKLYTDRGESGRVG
jgi:putative transposase